MEKNCFHCGLEIEKEVVFDNHSFCCNGCSTVYEILNQNHLSNFYALNKNAGIKPETSNNIVFDYLDSPEVFEKIVLFSDDKIAVVNLKIPVIHCSSCVWLLESLHDLNPHILNSQVNFTQKTLHLSFNYKELPLSQLAKFLTSLGYKPIINLESSEKITQKTDNSLIIKLAVAGFAFGNVMLFAFPEYLDKGDWWFEQYKDLFRFLSFLLSIPVVFYSASDYFKSAWAGIKHRIINIDIPIALGIIVLFLRSCYEAYFDISTGYFDSLCGLLFFMLIGKYFQQRTYKSLSFDRDFKSFYPIAITKIDFSGEQTVLLSDLKIGDRLIIRNQEMIPADAILIKGDGLIDNSFITGESKLIDKKPGDKIYAGGKHQGTLIEVELIKEVNQSYLTSLWNKDNRFHKKENIQNITNKVSQYFTVIILIIALLSSIYWYFIDISTMFQVLTAILIVACPCALALSAPFTLGNMMRIFSKKKFYVKEPYVIEKMAKVNEIVFDKTGTITLGNESKISYIGITLIQREIDELKSLLQNSTHVLSKKLYRKLDLSEEQYLQIENYEEILGKGISGKVRANHYQIGSRQFIKGEEEVNHNDLETSVYIKINDDIKGRFIFNNQYRKELTQVLTELKSYDLALLSGDNSLEKDYLKNVFPENSILLFNQSPENKVTFITNEQKKGKEVMMLGDGLNDAAAIKQADIGVAVVEDMNNWTPGSDAILNGSYIKDLPFLLKWSKQAVHIIIISFIISFSYNIIGLSFAITGHLSPLVAAILMPISSITIVIWTTVATWAVSYRKLSSDR